MKKESLFLKRLKARYQETNLKTEDVYRRTEQILKVFRMVKWSTDERFDELNQMVCMKDKGNFNIYLFDFAPELEMQLFQNRAESAFQSRIMIELVEKAGRIMKNYPDGGQTYYDILKLKYLDMTAHTDEQVQDELDLQKSTYYRKKKEAVLLMGWLLFGYFSDTFKQK